MKNIDNRKVFVVVKTADIDPQNIVAFAKALSDGAKVTSIGKAFKEIVTKFYNTHKNLNQSFESPVSLDSSVVNKIFRELENRTDRNFFNIPTFASINQRFNSLQEMAEWFADIVRVNHGSDTLLEVILQSQEIPPSKGAVVIVNPPDDLVDALSKRFVNTFFADFSAGVENAAKHIREQVAIRMPSVDLL